MENAVGRSRNSFASPAPFPALIALLFAASATYVPAAAQQIIGPGPTAPVASADYAGEDTCATCHADVAKDFAANPHHRLALEHGGKGVTCESCHGPGKAHVEGGGNPTKIFRFTSASAERIDSTCLRCHAAAHPNFQRSPHGEAGLSCTTCHSVHHAAPETYLLAGPQPQLCYRCHAEVRTAFEMPFHHRVPEGLMTCSDCHDPHGTFENSRLQLRDSADENAICTKCHTDTLGPFVYEHPVVKTDGCTSCHQPHGSPNARLLQVAQMNTLCLQCHSATNMVAFPHAVSPTGPVHDQAAQYVACTNCHTQIHGSNASNIFFR